jgi:hypothetical protein
MRISTEGRLGLWAAVVGLAGGGAVMIWPTHTEIGWSLIIIAVLGGAALAVHHVWERVVDFRKLGQTRRMIAFLGLLVCGIGFCGFTISYFWLAVPANGIEAAKEVRPLSMRDIFDSEFSGMGKYFSEIAIKTADKEWSGIPVSLYWDDRSNSIFMSFCLPNKNDDYTLTLILLQKSGEVLNDLRKNIDIVTSAPGRLGKTSLSTMAFTRQVYIYRETDFTIRQLYDLEKIAGTMKLNVSFFGEAYLALHWQEHGRYILGTRQSRADQAKAVQAPNLSDGTTGLPNSAPAVLVPPVPRAGKSPQTSP